MAIFHCAHNPVGRTTHRAGTAGAHARYVLRPGAAREVVGEHMPLGRDTSRAWLDDQEQRDRKNARVIDKVMVALPLELDQAERVQLVRDFAAEVGEGRIPWVAGIHDQGEDQANPHAHVIFRDRDHETGKRVAELSAKGSTEVIRETWERVTNQALERAGVEARVDRRSLEAQGIEREATIHVGPTAHAMEAKGLRPESMAQETDTGRVINWPEIDQGRTRPERLREIQAANDLGRDGDGGGREDGAPPAGASPATSPAAPASGPDPAPAEAPDPDQARARWAQQLRDLEARDQARARYMQQLREFAAEDVAAQTRETAQDAPPVPGRPEPTADEPEASPRPAQRPQEGVSRPEAPTPPADTPEAPRRPQERQDALAAERSRLAAAIERGWQKLSSLGQRLEAAWDRITQRRDQVEPDRRADRLQPPPEGRSSHDRQASPDRVPEPPQSGPRPADRPDLPPEPGLGRQDRDEPGHGPPPGAGQPKSKAPGLTPAQGLGRSLNHPLFAHRGRDGPDMPGL